MTTGALVVGISDYTNLQKLDFCKNDGKVYDLLTSLGYEISDQNKLIGKALGTKVKDTIYDFFDNKEIIQTIHYFSIILVMACLAMTETFTSHHPIQILINPTEEVFLSKSLE
ncbi:MAG: hypothetical protein WBZ36_28960 [Candidatus Nitrosopolaris sp.]